MDLISRQAAIDAADRADYTGLAIEDVKKVTDEVIKELKQLPSAQTEIVQKKGNWVFEDGTPVNRALNMCEIAICDQCGETAPGYPFWECDLELTNFCPNCGAKMDGGVNDETD